MSSLMAPLQNGQYKNQHTEQHKNTYNTKTQQTFRKNFFVCLTYTKCDACGPRNVYSKHTQKLQAEGRARRNVHFNYDTLLCRQRNPREDFLYMSSHAM